MEEFYVFRFYFRNCMTRKPRIEYFIAFFYFYFFVFEIDECCHDVLRNIINQICVFQSMNKQKERSSSIFHVCMPMPKPIWVSFMLFLLKIMIIIQSNFSFSLSTQFQNWPTYPESVVYHQYNRCTTTAFSLFFSINNNNKY